MIDQTECNTGVAPMMILADAGYASEQAFVSLGGHGLTACVTLGRQEKRQRAVMTANR